MSSQPEPNLSLTEQLQVLENMFAECLIADGPPGTLTLLWRQIKTIRKQLELPVYDTTRQTKK